MYLTSNNQFVLAADQSNIYYSYNNGYSWDPASSMLNFNPTCLALSDSSFVAGSFFSGVYVSKNLGQSWHTFNDGLNNLSVISLFTYNNYLFAGLTNGFIWSRPLSDLLTDVSELRNLTSLVLFQNFPNPFKARTKIEFILPVSEHITLKIYDLMGREVMRLTDEKLVAGKHEVNVDASELNNGVYVYKLRSGNQDIVKRMALLGK